MIVSTHHLIKFVHLRKNRQLLPCLQDLLVLSSVWLLGEWIYFLFLVMEGEFHVNKAEFQSEPNVPWPVELVRL